MPDSLTFNRGRQVSRQLTDTERALDDQVDSHLNQAPMQPIAGEERYGYAWLEQDLQQRAAITEQLGQERQLAAVSGGLQDMDRRFNQETQDEADAIEASRAINQFRVANPNATFGDAVNAATAERPDRWGNKFFVDQIDKMKGFHETDMERMKREGDLSVSIIGNRVNTMMGMAKTDALRSPEGQQYLKKVNELIIQKELAGYDLLPHEQELKLETMKNDLKMQKIRSQEIDFADTSFEGKSKIAYFMNESGFDVQNLDRLGSTLQGKKGVIEAIAHPTFISRNPAIAERLKSSLQILDNPDAKPADLAKAESDMALVAGAHAKYVGQTALALQEEERAMKWGADRGKSFEQLRQDIDDAVAEPYNSEKPPTMRGDERALNMAEMWIKESSMVDPRLDPVAKKHLDKINEIRKMKSGTPEEMAAKARAATWAAGDFAMEADKAGIASTKEVTPPTGAAKPTPAAATDVKALVQELNKQFGGDKEKVKAELRNRGYKVK